MLLRSSPPCRLALAAALCGVALAGHAGTPLYKWVDANGVTHYSDVPEPGAASIEAGTAQSYHAPPVVTAGGSPSRTAPTGGAGAYTNLEITSPENGAVLWNADGRIAVGATLAPGLASGHHLWFVLDGTRQSDPADGLAAQLEVPRGEHSLAAEIVDATGATLKRSASVTFTVRQNSAVSPPRGPTLTPKAPRHNAP